MRSLKALISKNTIYRAHVNIDWPNPYHLTEKDAKDKLEDWPLEVITLALYETVLYRRNKYSDSLNLLQKRGVVYAFQWDESEDGSNFWKDIHTRNFDVFYAKYTPEKLKEKLEQ